jgi:hypothetical protein
MNKRRAMFTTLLFFVPLFVLGILWWFTPALDFSPEENRTLAQRPYFSFKELFSGRWTGGFDEHFSDQFPLRNQLMDIAGEAGRMVYIEREGGTAIIQGDDNQDIIGTVAEIGENLFLIIGDRIMHMQEIHLDNNAYYAEVLGRFAAAMPERRVISMIVPNSFVLYAPAEYVRDVHDTGNAISQIYGALDSRIVTVDAFSFLYTHREKYLYFRTDHHWTARGAYWAYVAFCEAMGLKPSDIDAWESGRYYGFVGLRYRQVQGHPQAAAASRNPDVVEFFFPPTGYRATVFNDTAMANGQAVRMVNPGLPVDTVNLYNAFTEGDHPLIFIQTEVRNGRSIAVIKESFANAFVPFLLAHYENIYVIDFRFVNREDQPRLYLPDFVREHDIGDVLILNNFSVPNSRSLTDTLGLLLG